MTMMMMAASCVSFATAEAADLLREGQYRKAAELLQSSLVTLRSQIHFLGEVPEGRPADVPASTTSLRVRSVRVSGGDSSPLHSNRSHGAFELYDHIFVLDDDDSTAGLLPSCPGSCHALNRLTVIVLYNMGICYHLSSIQGHQPDHSMRKAIDLYQLAIWLMEITFDQSDPTDNGVYLAVLNNAGHAYQHQCDAANAQNCLRSLSGFLRTQGSGLRDRRTTTVSSLDLEHFYFTALLYDQVFPTASAA